MLLCPVRDCHKPLLREAKRFVCGLGHSFDIARSGYLNLLQPQERRSKLPGDTAAAVAARRRLHDRGITAPLLAGIADLLASKQDDVLLDAGCGDGFYLGNLQQQSACQAHGIDISIPAIDLAARRYPACQWIVANADRAIPFADATFSAITSITARRNAPEFARVLQPGGRLLVAIPAPDDLIELRGASRDRLDSTLQSFAPTFQLAQHRRVSTTAHLDDDAVHDILHSIYRPLQNKPLSAQQVTCSLDLLLLDRV
jgi:23S rRNA (guanine745-N1)-methyltransferase